MSELGACLSWARGMVSGRARHEERECTRPRRVAFACLDFRMLGERTLVVLSSYQYNIYLDATDVLAWCLP